MPSTRPPGPPALTQRDVDTSVQRGIAKQAEADAAAPADGSVAHAAIAPSLVLIRTQETVDSRPAEGTGAGVVVNADGTVLTALHVVDGAEHDHGRLRRRHDARRRGSRAASRAATSRC